MPIAGRFAFLGGLGDGVIHRPGEKPGVFLFAPTTALIIALEDGPELHEADPVAIVFVQAVDEAGFGIVDVAIEEGFDLGRHGFEADALRDGFAVSFTSLVSGIERSRSQAQSTEDRVPIGHKDFFANSILGIDLLEASPG